MLWISLILLLSLMLLISLILLISLMLWISLILLLSLLLIWDLSHFLMSLNAGKSQIQIISLHILWVIMNGTNLHPTHISMMFPDTVEMNHLHFHRVWLLQEVFLLLRPFHPYRSALSQNWKQLSKWWMKIQAPCSFSTTALAREAIFGKEEMARKSLTGRKSTGEMRVDYIRTLVHSRVPKKQSVEFESTWKWGRGSLSKSCQTLRNSAKKKGTYLWLPTEIELTHYH